MNKLETFTHFLMLYTCNSGYQRQLIARKTLIFCYYFLDIRIKAHFAVNIIGNASIILTKMQTEFKHYFVENEYDFVEMD
jgi:hypothetical protein